jgi:copper chaperone CopZ
MVARGAVTGVVALVVCVVFCSPAPARVRHRAANARARKPSLVARAARPHPVPAVGRVAAPAEPVAASEPCKAALEIPGLKTAEEVAAITRAWRDLPGVSTAIVDLRTRLAVVDYDPSLTNLPAILAVSEGAGLPANEYRVESRFPKPIKLKGG